MLEEATPDEISDIVVNFLKIRKCIMCYGMNELASNQSHQYLARICFPSINLKFVHSVTKQKSKNAIIILLLLVS